MAAEPEDPRVRLAGERTLLAWVRTGLAMMGFGFVIARFRFLLGEVAAPGSAGEPATFGLSLWMGVGLVVLGVIVQLAAAAQHVRFLQRLDRGEPYRPPAVSLAVVVSVLLAALGMGMTVYLFWLGR